MKMFSDVKQFGHLDKNKNEMLLSFNLPVKMRESIEGYICT